jgi:hypothetical protein
MKESDVLRAAQEIAASAKAGAIIGARARLLELERKVGEEQAGVRADAIALARSGWKGDAAELKSRNDIANKHAAILDACGMVVERAHRASLDLAALDDDVAALEDDDEAERAFEALGIAWSATT